MLKNQLKSILRAIVINLNEMSNIRLYLNFHGFMVKNSIISFGIINSYNT